MVHIHRTFTALLISYLCSVIPHPPPPPSLRPFPLLSLAPSLSSPSDLVYIVPPPPPCSLTGKQASRDRQCHQPHTHPSTLTGINLLEIPDPCHNDLVPSAVPGPEGDVPTIASVRGAEKKSRKEGTQAWMEASETEAWTTVGIALE
ncbi:hypothetical protein CGRA01v4_00089 [Colletotrichum graminicola]|nr:hypothetical protein CGRA01v4_00089 [Colletotrichum graminicola]